MEADNHLAALWMAGRGGGPWIAWPEGDPRPVQDVVHVPVALSMWIHPAFGYGLVLLADVIVGFLGGWMLSREAGASREGALVGMIGVGAAPFVGGAVVFGLSEAWPIGWLALHGAFLLRTARTGSARDAAFAGLCLAAYALSGWYAATFAALAAPVWLARIGSRGADRRGWTLVLAAGALAVILVLPALAVFLRHGDAAGLAARGVPAWEPRADWRHGSGFGADPLQLVLPGTPDTELARTVYLGVVALGLGLLGARRAPWAAAGLLWMALLALGPWAQIAGRPIGPPFPLPAAWLSSALPPLQGIAGWYRAAGPAAVFLAPLAALGATWLVDRTRPWMGYVLALLVLFDGLVLSDAPWPRPTYDARPPEALLALEGDGPVVLLPFDEAGRGRPYHRWLPWLRRPVSEHYEGPDPLRQDAVIGWLQASCGGSAGRSRWPEAPPPAAEPSADQLTPGIDWIVVLRDRARPSCLPTATRVLGDPDVLTPEIAAWRP
jgi:hypothetical protein